PPTKLYHHANALERAGLLRLSQTRQNRGAVEKWYVAARQAWSGQHLAESRSMQRAVTGLAAVALEQARREVELAVKSPSCNHPLVLRMTAAGDCERIAEIRRRLLAFLKQLRREANSGKRTRRRGVKPWTLTLAFAPSARARSR
ncbi:MAG TPA: hypothetical protein VFB00_07980, partial [Terriglobales bacterium]|nr:hypothetical protein [Terriglobales bacterium]